MIKRLFQPVDIASLVFFRIVFGILGLADILGTWIYYHLTKDVFNPENLQFKYYGFEWVQPLQEPYMSILFGTLCVLAVLIIFGKWYRIVTLLFAIGFTYTYFLEKANYLNHGYLFCWVCFVMALLPAHRGLSLDVKDKPALKRETIPYWCLFILQFFMGIVYFYGGVAKINPDWLSAIPLKQWLDYRSNTSVLGPLLKYEAVAYFMAYGGLLLDLTAPFLLMYRRTRSWMFIAIIFFHFINTLIFSIGIFPSLSLALSALYFRPDFPRRWIAWLSKRWKLIQQWHHHWREKTQTAVLLPMWQEEGYKKTIMLGLGALVVLHLLLPWRHHLFVGDVAWTEEGHRYSWRMMLRSKQGYGNFRLINNTTGEEELIAPADYLTKKQRRKLFTHPDMILQFAHYLRDKYEQEGEEVEIYANIKARLNYRDFCVYIDPDVNLAEVEWQYFKNADWIIPEKRDDE